MNFTKYEIWWLQAIIDFHKNELPEEVNYGELYQKLQTLDRK